MPRPDSGTLLDVGTSLVGLVDIEGFCGGPTMAFTHASGDRGRRPKLVASNFGAVHASKTAVADLSESLHRLYDQAMKLGHSEAALFIGCASLSIADALAVETVHAQLR
ncbi:MAG TPA: hypothetical protein VGG27_06400 [Magnetospirillaceae bacterium]